MAKNMFSGAFDKMVANFIPQQDDEARLSYQGTVVVKTNTPNGKEWIDKDGNIYMDEFISDFPVYTIAKAAKDVVVGDIVKLTKSTFAVVTEINDDKIETLSFGGQHRQAKAFKDMLLGQATIRVVVNFMQGVTNTTTGMNPFTMLAFLDKDSSDRNDFMKTIMLSSMLSGAGQNPFGNMFQNNNLALMLMMKGDNDSIQEMMLMQAMMNGSFANMFAPVAPAAPAGAANVD